MPFWFYPGGSVQLTLLDHQFTGFVTGGSHSFTVNCGSGGDVTFGAEINSSGTFGTVTIGGVTATQRVAISGFVAIYTATGVPSGSQTLTINITGGSGLSTRWGVQLYSIVGQSTLVPSSTSTTNSTTLNIPVGGAAMGASIEVGGTSTSVTYSGVTTRVSDDSGVLTVYGSGSDNFPSGNSSLSVSASGNGSGTFQTTWAVWSP